MTEKPLIRLSDLVEELARRVEADRPNLEAKLEEIAAAERLTAADYNLRINARPA